MKLVDPSDPVLWTPAAAVKDIAVEVKPHVEDMLGIIYQQIDGVALTALQVGIPLRFFVTTGRFLPSVIINPEIILVSPEMTPGKEGDFTQPGVYIDVPRHEVIEATFLNINGVRRRDRFRGISARIFQNNFDQLEGKRIFPRPAEGGGA